MSSLDDILRGSSSFLHESFDNDNYYDDFETLEKPKIKSEKSKMTAFIRSGKVDVDTNIVFTYKGNTYESLAEMGDILGLDMTQVVYLVKNTGMTFGEALLKAEDFEDCSERIEKIRQKREIALQDAIKSEERRKEAILQDRLNTELCALNRAVATSGLLAHINLLGLCRRDFLKVFAATLHSGHTLDIRYLRDLPRCTLENFVLNVQGFLSKLKNDLKIDKSKEDLLRAYYTAMWVDGIPHTQDDVEMFVKANIDKDLFLLMQEREEEIVNMATTNKVYNYIERNYKTFSISNPITTKTLDGWYDDLSRVLKLKPGYLKYLVDDENIPVDKVATCQKLQFLVHIDSIDYDFKCWGISRLEYYFDIYVDAFLHKFSIEDKNLNRPIDVTDLVLSCSAEHETSLASSSIRGGRLKMPLLTYYNRVEYDNSGIEYVANELAKDPSYRPD